MLTCPRFLHPRRARFGWRTPAFLSGMAAAAGIALINSVGNLGGFVGPYAAGALSDTTGSFHAGLLLLAAAVFVAGILALVVRHDRGLEEVEEAPAAASVAPGR